MDFFLGWSCPGATDTHSAFAECRRSGYGNHSCGFAVGFANSWPWSFPRATFHGDPFARDMALFAGYLRMSFNNAGEQHAALATKATRDSAIDKYCESSHHRRGDQGICKHALASAYAAFRHDTPCAEHWFVAQRA